MIGIRRKLFMQIGGLVLLLICLMFIANSLFMEPFYYGMQKKRLIDNFYTINDLTPQDYMVGSGALFKIESTHRVDVVISDQEGRLVYSSNPHIKSLVPYGNIPKFEDLYNKLKQMTKLKLPPIRVDKVEAINDNMTFIWATEPVFRIDNLILSGKLDNDHYVEIRMPISAIQQNIQMANQFLLVIASGIFLLSIGMAYVISVHFTQPIQAMNATTKHIKALDFSKKCQVASNDELGQLAESINELSDALSHTISDLNDQHQLLEEEIKKKAHLANKRKELLNNVSHELKTPLALVQGYAEMLKVKVNTPEKAKEYAFIIKDETEKMTHLIDTLLSVNQIEAGEFILKPGIFDMTDLIVQTSDRLTSLFTTQGLKVDFTDLIHHEVEADQALIERVVTNLLTNAAYHASEPKQLSVYTTMSPKAVTYHFVNTCPQLDEASLSAFWDSFYKADAARTREKSGLGLGLSIVAAIMEAHQLPYGARSHDSSIEFYLTFTLIKKTTA